VHAQRAGLHCLRFGIDTGEERGDGSGDIMNPMGSDNVDADDVGTALMGGFLQVSQMDSRRCIAAA